MELKRLEAVQANNLKVHYVDKYELIDPSRGELTLCGLAISEDTSARWPRVQYPVGLSAKQCKKCARTADLTNERMPDDSPAKPQDGQLAGDIRDVGLGDLVRFSTGRDTAFQGWVCSITEQSDGTTFVTARARKDPEEYADCVLEDPRSNFELLKEGSPRREAVADELKTYKREMEVMRKVNKRYLADRDEQTARAERLRLQYQAAMNENDAILSRYGALETFLRATEARIDGEELLELDPRAVEAYMRELGWETRDTEAGDRLIIWTRPDGAFGRLALDVTDSARLQYMRDAFTTLREYTQEKSDLYILWRILETQRADTQETAQKPKNPPSTTSEPLFKVGMRVRLIEDGRVGTITTVKNDTWALVRWDDRANQPLLTELSRLEALDWRDLIEDGDFIEYRFIGKLARGYVIRQYEIASEDAPVRALDASAESDGSLFERSIERSFITRVLNSSKDKPQAFLGDAAQADPAPVSDDDYDPKTKSPAPSLAAPNFAQVGDLIEFRPFGTNTLVRVRGRVIQNGYDGKNGGRAIVESVVDAGNQQASDLLGQDFLYGAPNIPYMIILSGNPTDKIPQTDGVVGFMLGDYIENTQQGTGFYKRRAFVSELLGAGRMRASFEDTNATIDTSASDWIMIQQSIVGPAIVKGDIVQLKSSDPVAGMKGKVMSIRFWQDGGFAASVVWESGGQGRYGLSDLRKVDPVESDRKPERPLSVGDVVEFTATISGVPNTLVRGYVESFKGRQPQLRLLNAPQNDSSLYSRIPVAGIRRVPVLDRIDKGDVIEWRDRYGVILKGVVIVASNPALRVRALSAKNPKDDLEVDYRSVIRIIETNERAAFASEADADEDVIRF